tara:strand:+ start:1771 stop:2400 length:630 start_codon:yes stop_codon:yes gene_type:complete
MDNTYIKTHDYTARIIMLGDCCVGKTSFTYKINNKNNLNFVYDPTIGVDYSSKMIHLKDDTTVKCQIWDTAGQIKFISIIRTYFKNISGIIVLFDLSKRKTFENLKIWFREIKENKNNYPISVMIIGNKLDIKNRQISIDEARRFAEENNAMYMEMSVKTGKNVDKVLKLLCEDIYKHKETNRGFKKIEGIKITQKKKVNDKLDCCCCF